MARRILVGTVLAALLLALRPATGSAAPPPGPGRDLMRLERVSTAVPWPRGLVLADDRLIVLARGRHRRAGGPDPSVQDMAGHLFEVDLAVSEPVIRGRKAGSAVRGNGRVLVRPSDPPFRLWNLDLKAVEDTRMDRPYCTLAYDPVSRNFFICGFSGADMPDGTFRKNATDSILRYDQRVDRWFVVEQHQPDSVPLEQLGPWVPNDSYPHHDPDRHAPPHGWINGPDGCTVVGRWLYAAGKDNSCLVAYDLTGIRADPAAAPPAGQVVLGEWARVEVAGSEQSMYLCGHSAVAAFGSWLYVGFRTTSQVIRFPIEADGTLVQPAVGQLVARFDPWDPDKRRSADLMDLAINEAGELFVCTAKTGRIWKVGIPDPSRVFDGTSGTSAQPYVDLQALTDNPKAKTGNITFGPQGRMYLCSGNYDTESRIAGVIYRVVTAE